MLAEVDAWLRELEQTHGWQVLYEELRLALFGRLVGGSHGHAVAVREVQPPFHPGRDLVEVRIELAHRHDDRLHLPVDRVAIDIDISEPVVAGNLLQLGEGAACDLRRRLPQPDVRHCLRTLVEGCSGLRRVHRA